MQFKGWKVSRFQIYFQNVNFKMFVEITVVCNKMFYKLHSYHIVWQHTCVHWIFYLSFLLLCNPHKSSPVSYIGWCILNGNQYIIIIIIIYWAPPPFFFLFQLYSHFETSQLFSQKTLLGRSLLFFHFLWCI